jgi:hypothetical protein
MTITVHTTKRDAQIAALHAFADWLAGNSAIPMPHLNINRHLMGVDGTEAENLATVRSLANQLGAEVDEHLDDRTVLRYRVGEHLWYELFAWHKAGRNACDEIEQLRARVAELEARDALTYSREADDPTPLTISDETIEAVGRMGTWNEREERWDDPTGLLYTRDDETDEPTAGLALTDRAHEVLSVAPVSPARVPMHIGVVDDEAGA